MTERKCPSCGAMVPFASSIALLAVCPFCRSLVRRKDLDVELLGQSAQLQPDGSPLKVGASGSFDGVPFNVMGRVQLKTKYGFWNEWYLEFADGRQGWLGEAQGTYAVSFKVEGKAPARKDVAMGSDVAVGGRTYRVRDLLEASYLAAEGALPYKPPLGAKAESADLVGDRGTFATLDWSEDEPLAFAGRYVAFDDLKLSGLKTFEGWS